METVTNSKKFFFMTILAFFGLLLAGCTKPNADVDAELSGDVADIETGANEDDSDADDVDAEGTGDDANDDDSDNDAEGTGDDANDDDANDDDSDNNTEGTGDDDADGEGDME